MNGYDLWQWRKAYGYSQRQLAKRLGLTQGFISQLEGVRNGSRSHWELLRLALKGIEREEEELAAWEEGRKREGGKILSLGNKKILTYRKGGE